MTSITASPNPYSALSSLYDEWVYDSRYRAWIVGLVGVAREHGLAGACALDVGCGTGLSTLPMLELGLEVTGCDPAPEMLACAETRLAGRARFVAAGLPDLPVLGEFDLILAANDIVNHLLDGDALRGAVAAVAANLAPGGLLVFDANTLMTYRGFFATAHCRDRERSFFAWRGLAPPDVASGEVCEGVVDAFVAEADTSWRRVSTRLVQRHHPHAEVTKALADAGLDVLAVLGQHDDGRRDPRAEELVHTKRVYVARRP
jgi:SAM-dependent methyltransferase